MYGQCRIIYVNNTTLGLIPYNGCLLTIGRCDFVLPAMTAFDTMKASLTPDTTYYVYAYLDTDRRVQMEFSIVARDRHISSGMQIKFGDPSRTLLGMVRIAWNGDILPPDSSFVGVKNWFNKRPFHLTNGGGPTRTLKTDTLYVNLLSQMDEAPVGYGGVKADGSPIYVKGAGLPGLIWGEEESILFGVQGEASSDADGGRVIITGGTAADGIYSNLYWSPVSVTSSKAGEIQNISSAQPFFEMRPREGYHEFTFYGQCIGGNATFYVVPWLMMTA